MVFKKNKRQIIAFTFTGIVILGVLYLLYNVENERLVLSCMFQKLTGYQCPGCGTQRSIQSLLHLEIRQGILYNPILVVAIPFVIIFVYLEQLNGKKRFPKLNRQISGKYSIISVSVIIMAYWILRNICRF